jgi:hypothetical protein
MIGEALIVVITFVVIVLAYRFFAGYYPGSKFIIEEPPLEKNGLDSDQARLMFFYTSWCPWSTKARAPWNSFKQMLTNTPVKYGGKTVLFEEINAESDKGKAALYRVVEYPTFKLETNDKLFLFKAIPDPVTFEAFLTSALGQKNSS